MYSTEPSEYQDDFRLIAGNLRYYLPARRARTRRSGMKPFKRRALGDAESDSQPDRRFSPEAMRPPLLDQERY